MELKKITERVFVQDEWRGANTGIIVTDDGVVLVDVPPEIENAREWRQLAESFGPIRLVINTESHHDHWITNSVFDALTITHERTYQDLEKMDHEYIRGRTEFIYTDPLYFPDEFPIKLPELTFNKDFRIRLGGVTIDLIHTPGHTEGQICVYLPDEKVLFAADTVLNGICTPFHDSLSDKRWLETFDLLESLDIDYLLSGHGSVPSDKSLINEQRQVILKFFEAQESGLFEDNHITKEIHRAIDPNYLTHPRGVHPRGVVLAPLDEAIKTGKHGNLNN